LQFIGQYPPPPPVATGPGLDRPLYSPDYVANNAAAVGGEGYTMNRTRLFYQDHMVSEAPEVTVGASFTFPDATNPSRGERRISGGERPSFDSQRRLENEGSRRYVI
jgi:hypothetical protein